MNEPPVGPSRREQQRDRMRAQLLNAALTLFAESGYDDTTLDQIAQRADVARQTVLNHFPLKRDFLRAWGERRREHLMDLLDQVPPDRSAAAQIQALYAAVASMNEQEAALTRTLYLSLRHDEVLAYQRPIPEAVLLTLRLGQDRGEFSRDVDAQLAAEVLTAVYFDTLSRWLHAAERATGALAPVLQAKVAIVLQGLRAQA